jgi:predicted house-cleaning noncanonical NTP pyrophosphatase (MazG superfamily)
MLLEKQSNVGGSNNDFWCYVHSGRISNWCINCVGVYQGVAMAKVLLRKTQVEICEYYEDRFSPEELAIMFEISVYQVKSVLEKYKVPIRTEYL